MPALDSIPVFLLKPPLLPLTYPLFNRSFGKVWKTIDVSIEESGFSKKTAVYHTTQQPYAACAKTEPVAAYQHLQLQYIKPNLSPLHKHVYAHCWIAEVYDMYATCALPASPIAASAAPGGIPELAPPGAGWPAAAQPSSAQVAVLASKGLAAPAGKDHGLLLYAPMFDHH